VTGSLDSTSQLCHWSIRGPSLYRWKGTFRVQDCAISPDGKRLVAADTDFKIHVFDFNSYEEDYCLSLSSKPTSVAISQDSKYLIVNLAEGEIQLIDMGTFEVVQRFSGHRQGQYVIRSTFGGAGENFVVSGSEGKSPCPFKKVPFVIVWLIPFRLEGLYLEQGRRTSRRSFGRTHPGMC